MSNEALFFLLALVDIAAIVLLSRLGKPGLVSAVAINMVLVSALGAQLVPLFGFVTNIGNGFYAVTFLAINAINEVFGRRAAFRAVLASFIGSVLFVALSQLALQFVGSSATAPLAAAAHTLFAVVPRIALASLAAFAGAHALNVWLYDSAKQLGEGKFLWLRHNLSHFIAEGTDSVLFFGIAFWGVLELPVLLQAMFIGFVVKVLVGFLATPFLYACKAWLRIPTHAETL